MADWTLKRTVFSALPGWHDDDHAAALEALARSDPDKLVKPYRTGSFGIRFDELSPIIKDAAAESQTGNSEARAFFEDRFTPFLIASAGSENGFVTGYYEPIVSASWQKTDVFRYPVYSPPADLVEIDESNPPDGIPSGFRFARKSSEGFEVHPDRGEIERGALAGQDLELAWLSDPVDLFFIHVQGAARLLMDDKSECRITYAAKSGHQFTGPGRILAEIGEIPLEQVTMQSIRSWFRNNPDRITEILWQNHSFIFFRIAGVDDPSMGPVAAAKVPLTTGRSIAVDRLIHTFGTPFFIDGPDVAMPDGQQLRRLMIAQDTGSAIIGPARADVFFGSGYEAGERAGVVKNEAQFYILVPDITVERLKL